MEGEVVVGWAVCSKFLHRKGTEALQISPWVLRWEWISGTREKTGPWKRGLCRAAGDRGRHGDREEGAPWKH